MKLNELLERLVAALGPSDGRTADREAVHPPRQASAQAQSQASALAPYAVQVTAALFHLFVTPQAFEELRNANPHSVELDEEGMSLRVQIGRHELTVFSEEEAWSAEGELRPAEAQA